ncbi:MAG: VCBS repeat-containing protein, partial [Kiritimatiellae bacterium]|nr:VCBS repeat-containing protein [Kiritimatiellia bacterium]
MKKVLLPVTAATSEGCLLAAQRFAVAGDARAAAEWFLALYQAKELRDATRLAALCGLIENDPSHLRQWIVEGLSQPSPVWRGTVAEMAVRRPDEVLRKALPGWLDAVPAEAQRALVESIIHGKVQAAKPVLSKLTASADPAIRRAAVEGLGALGDRDDVKPLAALLADADPALAEAARKSLVMMGAAGTDGDLVDLAGTYRKEPKTLVALLQVLTVRNPQGFAARLLPFLKHDDADVRAQAFEALTHQATANEVDAVVAAVPAAVSPKESKAAVKALSALARKYPEPMTGAMLRGMGPLTGELRRDFIRALGIAGTDAACQAVNRETRSPDADTADTAVRTLSNWQSSAACPLLLDVAAVYGKPSLKIVALRGALRLMDQERVPDGVAVWLNRAEPLLTRPDERALWLSAWGRIPTAEAVGKVKPFLNDPVLQATARQAMRRIALKVPVDIPDPRAPRATFAPLSFLPRRIAMCRTEACGVADFNGDGKPDICAGPFLYLAPDWKPIRIRQIPSDVKADGKGYADDFMNLPIDVNGDGKPDIISGGWFSKSSFWFENVPGDRLWPVHPIEQAGNHETGTLEDIDGDGKALEYLPQIPGSCLWYEIGKDAEGKPAVIRHDIGKDCQLGAGAGDLSGDGRPDIIYPNKWFEAPAGDIRKEPWKEHPIALGGKDKTATHTADILVYDVNRDGVNDIITSAAHGAGIYWYEQRRGENGQESEWIQHTIDDTWTQAHYLAFGDIDGDGIPELVTGKRFMAHNGGDPDAFGTLGLYYYDFTPGPDPVFRKHIIAYDQGISAALNLVLADIDGDGDIDLITTGKFGGPIIYENRGTEEISDEERKAALAPLFEGPKHDPMSDKNLALANKGAKAFADSEMNGSCKAEKLNDGLLCDTGSGDAMSRTRWHSALTPQPHWAEIRLPKVQKIAKVVVSFADPGGYATAYEL